MPRSKATAKAKKAAQPSSRPEFSNMVDKAERDEQVHRTERAPNGKRKTLEDDTEKALKDEFKKFTEHEIRLTVDKDGKSLYDRILAMKRLKKDVTDTAIGKIST